MSYSDEEIRSVVEQLVTSVIRRPVDALGRRGVEVTFNDIQEAAAGVFLLYPMAPFYVAELGTQRLNEDLQTAVATIEDLLVALGVLKRHVLPVKDVSSLKNAKAALYELETLSAGGTTTDLTVTSAYSRFNTNVDRFLAQAGAVKYNGDIVPTPQEARTKIPTYMSDFKAAMENLTQKAGYLKDSMDDFSATHLPHIVASSVMAKTRKVVDARADSLEAMTEDQRMEVLRETVLELLASKAAVKVFGQMPSMASVISISGTGVPFADSTRPGLEAGLTVDNAGPYAILVNDGSYELPIWLNGDLPPAAPSITIFLPESFWARIDGQVTEPYDIQASVNDGFHMEIYDHINGLVPVDVDLTAGTDRTALQICADINFALDSKYGAGNSPFIAEPYFAPLKFRGFAYASGANAYTHPLAGPPNNGTFPIDPATGNCFLEVGDMVKCITSPVGNAGQELVITGYVTGPADPQQLLLAPPTLAIAPVGDYDFIEAGPALRRVRLVPRDYTVSVINKHSISIKPETDKNRSTGYSIGFYGPLTSTSKPTHASILASYITKNSSVVTGSTNIFATHSYIQVRTDPAEVNKLIAFYFRGLASYPAGGPGVVTFTLDAPPEDGVLEVGQAVILRGGYEPGASGIITAVGSGTIDVNMSVAVTAASLALLEVGPATGIAVGYAINVADGNNAGRYYVSEVVSYFEVVIEGVPPYPSDSYGQPNFFRADIGPEHLLLVSKDTSTGSTVTLEPGVFMTAQATAYGSTRYLRLPETPRGLEEGNLLELYLTDYKVPDVTAEIETIFSDRVVKLDLYINSTVSWDFSASMPPYARVRANRVVDFETFKDQVDAWLSRPDMNVSHYFIDLNRLVNPLLVNKNPPGFAVAEAEQRVLDVYRLLTINAASEYNGVATDTLEAILDSYQVDPVDEVDALVRTFIEKGADRAVSILLEGRFSEFFGLSVEETSYAGDFQKRMREVAREDLPVNKVRRYDQRVGRLEASIPSPDYEFDSSDLDSSSVPDVPTDQG